MASRAGRHRRRQTAVSSAGLDCPHRRRRASGVDDDADPCGFEPQGEDGARLAAGSSVMARGIRRDHTWIRYGTSRGMSRRASAAHEQDLVSSSSRSIKGDHVMENRIRLSITNGIADVRLNRADKMNALDPAMFKAITNTGAR